MHIDQTNYKRWSFIVAFSLAIILLLMLFFGYGPSQACCAPPALESVPTAQIEPAELPAETPAEQPIAAATPTIVDEAFGFSATNQEVTTTGTSNNAPWLNKTEELKALLSGEDLRAQGNDQNITLTGLVESDAIKQQKYEAALAFFGSAVTIDNQLVIKSGIPPVTVAPAPATAKVYFASGQSNLSDTSTTALQAVIAWLNDQPDSRAIIQGFHDATGNPVNNLNLSKNRAQSVYDALLAAGTSSERIEVREPGDALGSGGLKEARRVEVSIE